MKLKSKKDAVESRLFPYRLSGLVDLMRSRFLWSLFCCLLLPLFAFAAPESWQIGFQEPATEWMQRVESFHSNLMVVMYMIVGVISLLLLLVCVKFGRNKVPSKVAHNAMIEVVWTAIPIVIVLAIAYPSVQLLKYQETVPEPDMTLKITAHQWYWNYNYPDHGDVSFDSRLKEDLQKGDLRLLAVDNRVVLPINTNIKLLVASADVIHSWGVPAFGVKQDAIPGRLNESWVNIQKEGVYYGQCFELCGYLHGYMPIVIEAVSKLKFKDWVENVAKKRFA